MFPNSLSFEAGLQQALDLCPPWSVNKAKFDPAEQQLRGLLCATPAPAIAALRVLQRQSPPQNVDRGMYGPPRFCKCSNIRMAKR